MNSSNMGPAPEAPHKEDMFADGGAQRPMSQQDGADSHGHEMHLQKFVRLVGCHEPNALSHGAAHPLHETPRR
jgi:hypothetical protein